MWDQYEVARYHVSGLVNAVHVTLFYLENMWTMWVELTVDVWSPLFGNNQGSSNSNTKPPVDKNNELTTVYF